MMSEFKYKNKPSSLRDKIIRGGLSTDMEIELGLFEGFIGYVEGEEREEDEAYKRSSYEWQRDIHK